MTAAKPKIYRQVAQCMLTGDRLPCYEIAMRFVYDERELGAPTLGKLATEAARRLVSWETAAHQRQWQAGCRMWIWTDDGELVGSVVVKLKLDPRLEAVEDTAQRESAA